MSGFVNHMVKIIQSKKEKKIINKKKQKLNNSLILSKNRFFVIIFKRCQEALHSTWAYLHHDSKIEIGTSQRKKKILLFQKKN